MLEELITLIKELIALLKKGETKRVCAREQEFTVIEKRTVKQPDGTLETIDFPVKRKFCVAWKDVPVEN